MNRYAKILCVERGFTKCSKKSATRGQIEEIRKFHEIQVINARHYLEGANNCLNEDEKKYISNVIVPFFPYFERVKAYLFSKGCLKAAEEIYQNFKFDIVHSHFAYVEGIVAKCIAEKFKKPLIITCRGSDLLVYPKNNFIKKKIIEVLNYASRVICVSDCLIDKAKEFGVNEKKLVKIADGVPVEYFNGVYNKSDLRDKCNIKSKYILLFVGNLLIAKGVYVLLDAFKEICNEFNATLIFIGDGNEKARIAKKINHLKLEDKIILLGKKNTDEVCRYMKISDCLVLPSFSESFGNVLLESLFCGVPVIGSNVGGIPEIINHDDLGIIVESNNVQALVKALKYILRNISIYSKDKILSHINKEYSQNETAKKVIKIYNQMFSDYLKNNS